MEDSPIPVHRPVLLAEVVEQLRPQSGQIALDCTCGDGGHAERLARCVGRSGHLVLNDADPAALDRSAQRIGDLEDSPHINPLQGNFVECPRKLVEMGLAADVVLADLGFSSSQMGDPLRGLSFQADGPLDMRFDPHSPTTAADLVASLSEEELIELLRDYGEERGARAIARKLVEERRSAPIDTTSRLATVVRRALGGRRPGSRIDPATRTFQALRIAVNDEMGSLGGLLEAVTRAASSMGHGGAGAPVWLAPGARVGLISFHSLEDRMVKESFRRLARRGLARILTPRPVTPGVDEIDANPRSRSAKLRAIELTS